MYHLIFLVDELQEYLIMSNSQSITGLYCCAFLLFLPSSLPPSPSPFLPILKTKPKVELWVGGMPSVYTYWANTPRHT